jgi:hypothetical protein
VNHRKYLSPGRFLRELLSFGGAILPFLAVYYAIALLSLPSAIRAIPGYSAYPATPKDPVLENPSWKVLGDLFAVALVVAVICFFTVKFLCRKISRPDFHVSKLVLMSCLAVVSVLGLIYNSYWAVTFLALPAWVWMLIPVSRGAGGRAANRIWIVAAGIPCVRAPALNTAGVGSGSKLLWYGVLALSTRTFTPTAFLLATAFISVGIRFLAIQSQSPCE